eukprot:TRINITY_DN2480_c0_g2_i4.p1 TRINITY_DN2480_c0_g2~~TRINITY_DN2480_c0_g2_i4.p1  ORF type:complete len:360 (-),score=83.54 TRINITY_DN2480_c0_g2_i4:189-1268(-)
MQPQLQGVEGGRERRRIRCFSATSCLSTQNRRNQNPSNPTEIPTSEGREMGEALVSSYWCYMCSQMVNPVMETEIKCPFCESGFVEEMDSRREEESDLADRALSLWAPVLLGMLGSHRRRQRFRSEEVEEEEQGGSQLERDSEAVLQRRRRRSEAILRLFQSIHAINASESDNSEREREREPTILTNPFNQSVILQGSSDSDQTHNDNQGIFGSLGDYFFGPGLDMLLQHLVDNDPNRYGTPPAQKGAVEAMPTVKIVENLQCSICLEDFNIGSEAKEIPCFSCLLTNQRIQMGQGMVERREVVKNGMDMGEGFGYLSHGLSVSCFPCQDLAVVSILLLLLLHQHQHLVVLKEMRIECV